MMSRTPLKSKVLAPVLALAVASQPLAAAAQSAPNSQATSAPPAGQYAPPPPGSEVPGSAYDQNAQQYDRAYADQYARWAAQNCIDPRTNTVAGAAIGGIAGAVLGSSAAGPGAHAAGAAAGGILGAAAGAAVGANATTACPPGYVVAAGAPAFYYANPTYPAAVVYGPAWYQPWVWVEGRWVYRPYRYWYWTSQAHWRPGSRPGPWRDHYGRW